MDQSLHTTDELYPLALLMDELKHDDIGSRVQAMKRIETVALALGPERSREELLPFLDEVVSDDEDEVITVTAQQLGHLVPLIGGSQYAPLLLPTLEKIAGFEEPIVRESAIDSLDAISKDLSPEELISQFVPIIDRLAKNQWFSFRVAAAGLFKSCVTRVDSALRKELLELYLELVRDESPMVRRACGNQLPHLIDILSMAFHEPSQLGEFQWDLIVSMFHATLNDQQDSVKFLAVDIVISLLKHVRKITKPSETSSVDRDFYSAVLDLAGDESWRVRYMVADRFVTLMSELPHECVLDMVAHTPSLIKDNEAEVRKAISKQLPGFCKVVADNELILREIVPCLADLSNDESEVVRSALASQLANLTPLLGRDLTVEYLAPILVAMLKDDFSEVRLNVISNLQVVNDVVGIQLLSESLLPAITALAEDKQWRVRLAIIEQIPLLARQLGVSFFNESLGSLSMTWLSDPVFSIREAAVANLAKLTEIFGQDWAKRELVDRILQNKAHLDNFIYRITCLFALSELVPVVSSETVEKEIFPFVESLVEDHVPNIRFNAAQTLSSIAVCAPLVKSRVVPLLEKLSQDEDVDVRFYANEALQSLN